MRYGLSGKSTETVRTVPAVAAAAPAVWGKNIAVNNWSWADAFLESVSPFSLFALLEGL